MKRARRPLHHVAAPPKGPAPLRLGDVVGINLVLLGLCAFMWTFDPHGPGLLRGFVYLASLLVRLGVIALWGVASFAALMMAAHHPGRLFGEPDATPADPRVSRIVEPVHWAGVLALTVFLGTHMPSAVGVLASLVMATLLVSPVTAVVKTLILSSGWARGLAGAVAVLLTVAAFIPAMVDFQRPLYLLALGCAIPVVSFGAWAQFPDDSLLANHNLGGLAYFLVLAIAFTLYTQGVQRVRLHACEQNLLSMSRAIRSLPSPPRTLERPDGACTYDYRSAGSAWTVMCTGIAHPMVEAYYPRITSEAPERVDEGPTR